MHARRTSTALAVLLLLSSAPRLRAEGVRIVAAPALGSLPDIQTAVDAAADGDVLLVAQGEYGGFTIDGKALTVVAFRAGVEIEGAVVVRNLPAGRSVLLLGLAVRGRQLPGTSETALTLQGNQGQVRVQGCTLVGGPGVTNGTSTAGLGLRCTASAQVLVSGTSIEGGRGRDANGATYGANGGDGLRTNGGALVLYDCVATGGRGGTAYDYGGDGGDGAEVVDYGLFASRTTFRGGRGGDGYYTFSYGGAGGHGLFVGGAGQAQLLQPVTIGGAGGIGMFGQPGPHGLPITGDGIVVTHPGVGRRLAATPHIAAEGGSLQLSVEGVAGDLVHLPSAFRPGWRPLVPTTGVWGLPFPLFIGPALGVLPSAAASFPLVLPPTSPPGGSRTWYRQGWLLDANGQGWLGTPLHVVALDPDALPDCDGNGVNDLVEMLPGGLDCNANLVLDACEIAGGQDCNNNGVVDACDIASGTSPDVNGNGIPDECEGMTTYWVDASAPPGGNGSFPAPFRTIAEGVQATVGGDVVVVRDGVYVGPGNREVDLGSRWLTLRSENGPAACVIDCEGLGRAFRSLSTTALGPARIEGLTVINGLSHEGGAMAFYRPDVEVIGCILRDNRHAGSVNGGGALFTRAAVQIEDCVFEYNLGGNGGAIMILGNSSLPTRIVGCRFVGNQGVSGGAVYFSKSYPIGGLLLSGCEFLGNRAASFWGGALYLFNRADVDGCLFSGNSASQHGGAIFARNGTSSLSNLTFSGNHAGQAGGAVAAGSYADVRIDNCVVWGNAAPAGQELALIPLSQYSADMEVSRSDVRGGQAGVHVAVGTLVWGAGNLDVDPQYVDPDGPDDDPLTWIDNDFRLAAGSPCNDAGDNALVALDVHDLDGDGDTGEPVPFDLDGSPRFADDPLAPDTGVGLPPLVDLGAYERQP